MQRCRTFESMGSKDIGRKFEISFITPSLGKVIMLEIFHFTGILPELKLLLKRSLSNEDIAIGSKIFEQCSWNSVWTCSAVVIKRKK
jgi:hypothetical protein